MKKVEFSKNDEYSYDVFVNEYKYGKLVFDKENGVWGLWSIDGGTDVFYFEDLKETQDTITEEINDFDDEDFLN